MPDTDIITKFDLRHPDQNEAFYKAADKAIRGFRKRKFKARELAEEVGCNMSQARRVLNARIAEGVLTYEGATRDMTYQRA